MMICGYEVHEAANAFPMMSKGEFESLKESIRTEGLNHPVLLYGGKIIDGRNRALACEQLGIVPAVEHRDDERPWGLVWKENGERRELDSKEQKYLIWKHCNENDAAWQDQQRAIKDEANKKRSEAAEGNENAAKVKNSSRTTCSTTVSKKKKGNKTRAAKAEASKTNRGAVQRGDELAEKRPDLVEKVREGEMSASRARKEMKKEETITNMALACVSLKSEALENMDAVCDIRHCSCKELFETGIRPDVVITDPPYPKEYLDVFSELAVACRGVPVVAVMSGQSYLPEVIDRLCRHLKYRWTIAYLTPGGQAVQQWDAKVNTTWKPVLLFGDAPDWFGDVAKSSVNDNDKSMHEWGQSESGMLDLVSRLSKPGQLICDPFAGAGTTAIAAIASGRRFVGCDIDADSVETARNRAKVKLCGK